jgi:hypothetical protein
MQTENTDVTTLLSASKKENTVSLYTAMKLASQTVKLSTTTKELSSRVARDLLSRQKKSRK